jgi:hypothetical protein
MVKNNTAIQHLPTNFQEPMDFYVQDLGGLPLVASGFTSPFGFAPIITVINNDAGAPHNYQFIAQVLYEYFPSD